MLTGQRPGSRRRSREIRRAARIAVPLAIPVALGVTLGVVFAVSSHGTTNVNQSAFGRHHHDGGSPYGHARRATASAHRDRIGHGHAPRATATATGAAAAVAARQFVRQRRHRHSSSSVTSRRPRSTARAPPINLNQTAAAGRGLDELHARRAGQPAQRAGPGDAVAARRRLLDGERRHRGRVRRGDDPRAERLRSRSTTRSSSPRAPRPPWRRRRRRSPGARWSSISVGFNGTNLALTGAGARQGNCVDALGQSLIGQVSACNAVTSTRRRTRNRQGHPEGPGPGTATDGQACQTTRDFALIDQDQSDNVVSQYLINANGQTAQNTAANKAANSSVRTSSSTAATRADQRVRRPG